MGRECGRVGMEMGLGGERKGVEMELNLELSIGGRYGKKENSSNGEIRNNLFQENVNGDCSNSVLSRFNFSSGEVDLQRRREIQALRRQEARRKREEKIKKSRGQNDVGFVEDKLFLEAQKLQARVQKREIRERDCLSENNATRKKDKNDINGVGDDLSLSLFTDNKISNQGTDSYSLYPKVHQHLAHGNGFPYSCGVIQSWGHNGGEGEKNEGNVLCRISGAYSSVDCDSEHSNGLNDLGNGKTTSNRSLEQCSSAVSDYHSISHRGGSSSDTGSQSSPSRPSQCLAIPRNSFSLERHESCSEAETDHVVGGPDVGRNSVQSNWSKPNDVSKQDSCLDQTNNSRSKGVNPSNDTNASVNKKPPRPSPMPKIPCVSATGIGPNGKTIRGVLYKYNEREVSIMCVCHGNSFSPAEFVEHAGGVNVSQPLKHITIVSAGL